MKKPKSISVILNGEYKADFTLEFKSKKNGETTGILTIPYLKWVTPEESYLNYRVLEIKDSRELECYERYFFDEDTPAIPVEGNLGEVEMGDIYYKVLPSEIYEQMISGTFKIAKDADQEYFSSYIKKEKENKSAIRQFISEQKKRGVEVKSRTILYAKKLNVPTSSKDQVSVVLVKKLSKGGKYKVQVYMNPVSGKKQIFQEGEFDEIYIAKKFFDSFEYKDKDVLLNKKRFQSLIADFTGKNQKIDPYSINQTKNAGTAKNTNAKNVVPKVKKMLKEQLSPEEAERFNDMLSNIFPEDTEDEK